MKNLHLYLFRLLVFFIKSTSINGSKETYNGIMETLQYPEKILFDITKPLNEELGRSFSYISVKEAVELETLGVRLSPLIYYGQDGIRYNESGFVHSTNVNKQFTFEYPWVNATIPVYFIQNRSGIETAAETQRLSPILALTIEDVGNSLMNNSNTEQLTLIFNTRAWNTHIKRKRVSDRLEQLISHFKTQWPNLKVGLEYNYYNNRRTYYFIRSVVKLIDVLVVSIDIEPKNFILSYTQFKKNLREILDENYDFIQIGSSNITTYVKLNFPGQTKQTEEFFHSNTMFEKLEYYTDLTIESELYQKYYYYMLQFAVYWINENEKEGLILETFFNIDEPIDDLQGSPLNELLVIPFLSKLKLSELGGICAVKATLDHIYTQFQTIRAKPKDFMELIDDKNACVMTNSASWDPGRMESEICKWPKGSESIPDINLSYNANLIASSEKAKLNQLRPILMLANGDMPWKQIEFNIYQGGWSKSVVERELDPLLNGIPAGIDIACNSMHDFATYDTKMLANYTNVINGSYEQCQYMWNQSNIIIWNIKPDTKDALLLTERLMLVELERKKFLDQFPNKTVLIRFILERGSNLEKNEEIFGIYCRPVVLLYNELAELILHFARIHKIPLEIEDVIGYFEDYHGGWRHIVTIRELRVENTNFPVFVARDFPDNFLLGEFKTDPCISWTSEVARGGLQINVGYSGTTLYIGEVMERRLTIDELETMLLFTLHKFSMVEIIPETFDDINTIVELLSKQEFVEKLAAEGSKVEKLYLRFDLQMVAESHLKLHKMFKKLANSTLKPIGIHFVNWNNSVNTNLTVLKEVGIMIGISLENCVEEVNARFLNLKNSSFFHQHDYVLCNIEPVAEASNINTEKVVKYLDTTLYIQKYFQKMFPNVSSQLLFRLNTFPSKSSVDEEVVFVHGKTERVVRNEVSNFLTYFADVNQYASLYKMKFFMLPAFDDVIGKQFGWWRILDFENLANTSAYVEKESEYLGEDTWRPTESPMSPTNLTWIIITAIAIISALLICLGIVLQVWYRRQYVLLTKQEVLEFQYGKLEDGSEEKKIFENLEFPDKYHIPKREIVLESIIGKGNFGLVYKATCSLEAENESVLTVAVKIPHPNCTNGAFKSLLSELKILCYVGSHPHVVGFVGAYIKEIGRGIVNIATELCENGALQEYLRKLHSQQAVEGNGCELGNLNPNLYKLCRFAQEIASGMDFISSKKIVHGDLSTRNVLLDTDFRCKIADFGLSRKLYEYQEYIKKSSEPLPWRWLAIESLKRMEFTTKSDVWSYGITLWEIFSLGSVPYPGLAWTDQFVEDLEKGYRMSAPIHSTTQIYEQMKRCWDLDPPRRPTFTELSQKFETICNSEYVTIG